ncbi:YqaJ viral recombinase family protein [Candidatus Saccharibacteria bacterium]|nr:YqaJ viral recombinase family protein [Candidatus Saccharibacteria bacterium]
MRRIHHRLEQRSPQWLMARLGKFTASRAADLMAFGRKGDPLQARTDYLAEIACERLTGQHLDHYVSPAMQRGIELEPEAIAAYCAETGVIVDDGGYWEIEGLPVGASPDALVGSDGIAQIKCPASQTRHLRVLQERSVPKEYVPQVQWELWVTGRAWSDFVSYDPRFPDRLRLAIVRVLPDAELHRRFEEIARSSDEEVRAIIEGLKSATTGG